MKSFLYAGAALMIGASIYGFIDYRQTSHKKEFTNMYTEKETKPVVVAPAGNYQPKKETNTVLKLETVKNNKKAEKIQNKEMLIDEAEKYAAEKKEENISKKSKRKLNTKLFSRAPLREEIEELPAPVKTDSRKIESKVQ